MTDAIRFYTLLYVDDREVIVHNRQRVGDSTLSVYLPCAILLHESCATQGLMVRILTNRPEHINAELQRLGKPPLAVGIEFRDDVPPTINYYAAHFKLDALRALGSGALGARVALVDGDVVMLRPFPAASVAWRPDLLMVYDLSAVVAAEFGWTYVAEDVEKLTGTYLARARWFGGEFIAGHSDAFRTLSDRVEAIWPRYRALHAQTRHEGDEMIVSAALELLSRDGMALTDIGAPDRRWIGRWFSARTGYQQAPLSQHLDCTFLHLPSDKRFLVGRALQPFEPDTFAAAFKRYAARKIRNRNVVNALDRLRGRARYVGRLA